MHIYFQNNEFNNILLLHLHSSRIHFCSHNG